MGLVLLIIIVGGLIWLTNKAREQAALNKAAQDSFMAKHEGWDVYVALRHAVIALNHDTSFVVLGTLDNHKRYPWSAIASVEVARNGASVTSTSRGSQVMGAAVGEVLLGPMGLLIGGVTGSKRTVQRISQIGIKIIVDDRYTPVYTIDFLQVPGNGAHPNNRLVKDAATRADHVHALLVNAIRKASLPPPISERQIPEQSVPDRIEQLWKLKEAGALTEGEFEEQKAYVMAHVQRLPDGRS